MQVRRTALVLINEDQLSPQRPRIPPMLRRLVPLLAALLVAACGGSAAVSYDQTSPGQILKDAANSLGSVKSEHVKFQGTTTSGQVGFEADVEGQNFNGTVAIGGNTAKILAVAGKVYIYGPDIVALLPTNDPTVADRVKALVGTNWVILPNSSTVTGDLNTFLNFRTVADCIKSLSGLKKKGTSNVEGNSVVEVDDSTGAQIFVLVSSPHYPRRMILGTTTCSSNFGTSGSGSIDLTQENATFNIKAPTNVVDLSTLTGG